jgi:nickel-dependent lactate racemase
MFNPVFRLEKESISADEVKQAIQNWLSGFDKPIRKVLLLPPDLTRAHSKAGLIVQILYRQLSTGAQVDIMPALGTHLAMTEKELRSMYGDEIPLDCFLVHDWRNDVVCIGEVPAEYVKKVSGGLVEYPIKIQVNKRLLDPSYDLIISIGQVVPHEVVGMANYSKNIFVGCGGKEIIDKSHFLGAVWGMERLMGKDHSPVRQVFDYAEKQFCQDLPLQYILTVTATKQGRTDLKGLYLGRPRSLFEMAVKRSQRYNLDLLEKPLKKVVVYLDPAEFKSTWLGNKAIYRTRMAIADEGELIIIAPGLRQFGEDSQIDELIAKYGYCGTPRIFEATKNADLKDCLSAAAHLIHGSSEGRFKIYYAPGHVSKEDIEKVNFNYLDINETLNRYNPSVLKDGFNTLSDGEEVFFISNPALGLWALKDKFVEN